jgi:hypothetical protein
MNKKLTAARLLGHVTFWLAWYCINSLAYFLQLKNLNFTTSVYNFLSLVCVFYLVKHYAGIYFRDISFAEGISKSPFHKFLYYFGKASVLNIVLVAIGYILISWYVDQYIFNLNYPSFALYSDGRWTREAVYIFVSIGYSYYKYKVEKYRMEIEMYRNKVISLEEYINNKVSEQNRVIQLLKKQIRDLK